MRFDLIEFDRSYGTSGQLVASSVPEVVFSGRSNVGKSSLINKLFNRKNLARVSSVPGKTVTVNFFKGDCVNFVDLPGYGYAKASHAEKKRWAELMEGFFNSDRKISLVVQLIDVRHKPSADDYDMLEYLKAGGYKTVIAMTKIDKLNKTQRTKRLKELETELADYGEMEKIPFSSLNGEGVEALRKAIERAVNQ
ncbi:MAG: YihA family ribosome biogenesis GTP-binding protein [Clostridia bacterium]|nr:YihA family ribosome biogenesis GTP-binding protein [Clostridia bacterium]